MELKSLLGRHAPFVRARRRMRTTRPSGCLPPVRAGRPRVGARPRNPTGPLSSTEPFASAVTQGSRRGRAGTLIGDDRSASEACASTTPVRHRGSNLASTRTVSDGLRRFDGPKRLKSRRVASATWPCRVHRRLEAPRYFVNASHPVGARGPGRHGINGRGVDHARC